MWTSAGLTILDGARPARRCPACLTGVNLELGTGPSIDSYSDEGKGGGMDRIGAERRGRSRVDLDGTNIDHNVTSGGRILA